MPKLEFPPWVRVHLYNIEEKTGGVINQDCKHNLCA